jgi:hypothetical protein
MPSTIATDRLSSGASNDVPAKLQRLTQTERYILSYIQRERGMKETAHDWLFMCHSLTESLVTTERRLKVVVREFPLDDHCVIPLLL